MKTTRLSLSNSSVLLASTPRRHIVVICTSVFLCMCVCEGEGEGEVSTSELLRLALGTHKVGEAQHFVLAIRRTRADELHARRLLVLLYMHSLLFDELCVFWCVWIGS